MILNQFMLALIQFYHLETVKTLGNIRFVSKKRIGASEMNAPDEKTDPGFALHDAVYSSSYAELSGLTIKREIQNCLGCFTIPLIQQCNCLDLHSGILRQPGDLNGRPPWWVGSEKGTVNLIH